MDFIWVILQILIGYNLVLPSFLYLLSTFKRRRRSKLRLTSNELDYAIIVTAYEQVNMLPDVIDSLFRLNYKKYHIYIVADNCDTSSLSLFGSRLTLLRPPAILANNLKSHFYAIERFERKHDIITIIDSDNIVHPEYINELNYFFEEGFEAVQGVRRPKKLESTLACLDAARDLYYNFYDGKVLFELGSSATLAGSGMAFKSKTFIESLKDVQIEGAGFDKVLQAKLVGDGLRIAYAPEAIVYDEKTSRSEQLINQRSRWINTWFKYNGFGKDLILKGIVKRDVNRFLFGLVLLRPPLFLFILTSLACLICNLFLNPLYAAIWVIALALFVSSFLFALVRQNTDNRIYHSLLMTPKFIFLQVVSLYFSRVANKRSVATKH